MTQGHIGQPHNEVIMSRYQKNERLKMSVFLREMIVDIDYCALPCTLYPVRSGSALVLAIAGAPLTPFWIL